MFCSIHIPLFEYDLSKDVLFSFVDIMMSPLSQLTKGPLIFFNVTFLLLYRHGPANGGAVSGQ